MARVVGWMCAVTCRGCGTRGDWHIHEQCWTCVACGRVLHVSPTMDDDVQLNVRRIHLARLMTGELC